MIVCRVCGSPEVRQVLDLGEVPLANGFIDPEHPPEREPTYPLGLQACATCAVVQIPVTVDPETLFRHYVYTPSASSTWRQHCDELAGWLWERIDHRRDAFVVEPASNDGCLLKSIQRLVPNVLGVEPALNIANQAIREGVPTVTEFFTEATARAIRQTHGPADVVVGTNVLAHVPDLVDFLRGAASLLAPDGRFVVEAPYLRDLVEKVAYDTIYHEHVSYFSVTALERIYPLAGLTLTAVERIDVHGGSIRFTGRQAGTQPDDGSVEAIVNEERALGYADGRALQDFAARVDRLRRELRSLVSSLRQDGQTIAAYGATAKGNTLLTTCELTGHDISYIVDRSPLKQGLLAPGTRIPVVGPEHLDSNPVDVLLLLAWNLKDEVMAQTASFRERGGRFLVPVPDPALV